MFFFLKLTEPSLEKKISLEIVTNYFQRDVVKHGSGKFTLIYSWMIKSDGSLNCELRDSGCPKFQLASNVE